MQNIFILHCLYYCFYFSLKNVQDGFILFLYLVYFILYYMSKFLFTKEDKFLYLHLFVFIFPPSLFNWNLPPKRYYSNWNLRKFYYTHTKIPLLKIATKEFHPITCSLFFWHFITISIKSVANWNLVLSMNYSAWLTYCNL